MNPNYHPCKLARYEIRVIENNGYIETNKRRAWGGVLDQDNLTMNYLDVFNAVFYQAYVDLVYAYRDHIHWQDRLAKMTLDKLGGKSDPFEDRRTKERERYARGSVEYLESFLFEVMPSYLNIDPQLLCDHALAYARFGKKSFDNPLYSGFFYSTSFGCVDRTSPDDSAFKYLLYQGNDHEEESEYEETIPHF